MSPVARGRGHVTAAASGRSEVIHAKRDGVEPWMNPNPGLACVRSWWMSLDPE